MPPEPFILDGWPRKVVKAAFYTLLNAESPTAARRAIAEHFGRSRGGYTKAGKLIAEIERKHPAIADQFGTGAGLRLMRKDSDITEYILNKLLRGGGFALPIHDSYRVPHQIAGRTREIMDEALAKSTRKRATVSMAFSSSQAPDKTTERVGPHLQNGSQPVLGGLCPFLGCYLLASWPGFFSCRGLVLWVAASIGLFLCIRHDRRRLGN